MPLDLAEIGRQVRSMHDTMTLNRPTTVERLEQIHATYADAIGQEEHWSAAVDLSREGFTNHWLLAEPFEPFDTIHTAPPSPSNYAVAATDGSSIEPDRHGMLPCYLINTGQVYLRYGEQPFARLTSTPQIYYREEDLILTEGVNRVPIEGDYLAVQRDVAEGAALAAMCQEALSANPTLPTVALVDGTFLRWALERAKPFVRDFFLNRYLAFLDTLQALNVPVAAYASRTRSTESMGLVRLMLCPDVKVEASQGAKCNDCSDLRAGREPSCYICNGLTDADLFAGRLRPGERGPLFSSLSRINQSYRQHRVMFFYLNVGREIARIEVPAWVARDPALLDRVHGLVYDQVMRGEGYPVALARSHEQAVLRPNDRQTFEQMVYEMMARSGLRVDTSLKREKKNRVAV